MKTNKQTMQKLHKQKLAIIGTVGVPARYGGFETLAEQLVLQMREEYDITVFNSTEAYPKGQRPATWEGAKLVYLPLKANGFQSIMYDIISMMYALLFSDVLLVLGVSGCMALPIIKLFSRKRILVNVDGLEWRRPKWQGFARRFLQWSEMLAARYADEIIADNAAIQKYLQDRYNRPSRLIAYGADHVHPVAMEEADQKRYSFLGQPYAFKVCRIEPENNIEMVLAAFAHQHKLPLVLVGNWNNSPYGMELREQYAGYLHLHLLDPIYDARELNLLRSNCSLYVHGHSAGGTNPSLIEAMHLGLPVFAFDVVYNRVTTEQKARYFSNARDLTALLFSSSVYEMEKLSETMAHIAQHRYTWRRIAYLYNEAIVGQQEVAVPVFDFDLPQALRQAM